MRQRSWQVVLRVSAHIPTSRILPQLKTETKRSCVFPSGFIVSQSMCSEKGVICVYLHNNHIYHSSPSLQNTRLPSFPAASFLPRDPWKPEKLKGMKVLFKDCFQNFVVLIVALSCSFRHSFIFCLLHLYVHHCVYIICIFFTWRVVQHLKMSPEKLGASPPLKIFKSHLDKATDEFLWDWW